MPAFLDLHTQIRILREQYSYLRNDAPAAKRGMSNLISCSLAMTSSCFHIRENKKLGGTVTNNLVYEENEH